MKLSSLGWSAFFAKDNPENQTVARITAIHRSHLVAIAENKELHLYLQGLGDLDLSVGDWVLTTPEFIGETGAPSAIIKSVLPRKSKISRATKSGEQLIAANIDTVFIVTSANQDLNLNRLHRFLVLVRQGGATPAIVLSKIDLHDEAADLISTLKTKIGVTVIGTSMHRPESVQSVRSLMPEGSTSIFIGSSGVGKSTLVNRLLNGNAQPTKDIREDDGKGRHTTTSRQMFAIPGGGLIIDTPGIRAVQVFGSSDSLNETFPLVEELIKKCKFSDCRHQSEPGCAISKALATDELDLKEWENYQKLLKEMAFANRKMHKAEMSNAKKRWRDINVTMRKKRKLEKGG